MDQTTNKLILLYVFDQMEIPVTIDTLNEMCCSQQNNWLTYLSLTQILPELVDARFLTTYSSAGAEYYKITQEGRDCINFFFMKIPSSLRVKIGDFIKKNRQAFKRKQEYFRDYWKNKDGTYTVNLKIIDPSCSKLEMKINVANYAEAKLVFNRWDSMASEVYSAIYRILIDG